MSLKGLLGFATKYLLQADSYLTIQAGLDHLPGLRVNIIAVQLVGQSVVCGTSKYIEMTVEGNHCVTVTSLGRRRGAAQ